MREHWHLHLRRDRSTAPPRTFRGRSRSSGRPLWRRRWRWHGTSWMRTGFRQIPITLVRPASSLTFRAERSYRLFSGLPHSVVVYPTSTEDVVKIINIARKYRMPVVPYSGGTSLEGQFTGVRACRCAARANHIQSMLQRKGGGICLDMSEMDKIIAIHGMF